MLSRKEGGFSKALSRVKQKVDQNLGRAEATRPLNDDSLEAERRIGNVQKAMERFGKAAKEYTEHCTKPPEEILMKSFQKNGEALGQMRDLGDIWLGAANTEKKLATERENLQSIMKSTMDDRCRHVEEQLSNVRRMRRDLDNYILDMDAARRRYTQMMRQQGNNASAYPAGGPSSYVDGSWSSNSTSPPPPDFSGDVLSALQKVECARDSLEAEMNEIIAHECEYSEVVLQFLEEQAAYHERSLQILRSAIPSLRERLNESINRPVFGLPLSDHLRLWHRRTALVIEYCCLHLLKFGKTEEGLFRVAAGASKIRRLRSKFNSGQLNTYPWPPPMPTVNDYSVSESAISGQTSTSSSPEFNLPSTDPNDTGELDVHALAGVLKQYLRDLPDPLLTTALSEEWTQAASLPEEDRLVVVQALLSRLPPENYENLRYLIHFLSLLTQFADQNRMTPSNVGIVIGPSIMPSSPRAAENAVAAAAMGANMQLTQPAVIVQTFIEHVDLLFPGRTAFKPESHVYLYDDAKSGGNRLRSSSGIDDKPLQPRRTLSNPNASLEPPERRGSKCVADQSVPSADSRVVPDDENADKRKCPGIPASGAFFTEKGTKQPRQNNAKNDKKSAAVPPDSKKVQSSQSQNVHGSPRIMVKSILNSISHPHRHSHELTVPNDVESSRCSRFSESEVPRNFPKTVETPAVVAVRRTVPSSDMEITSGSMSIRTNDEETVAVLDTNDVKKNKGERQHAVLADAAFQRAIRAEVRRLKSKEMRNRFFANDSSSSTETPRISVLAASVPDDTSVINASLTLPSMPKGVLIFPPVSNNESQLQQPSPDYYSSSGHSVAESPEVPEHCVGQQIVPNDRVFPQRPAVPPPPVPVQPPTVPSAAKTVLVTANDVSQAPAQPTFLPAFNKVPDNDTKQHSQSQIQRDMSIGSGPSLPRRRAPIAPPQVPPPPPPPTTPPPNIVPHQQANLPPPLVPTPVHPLRSSSSKTVAVLQTTPTNEYDPMLANREARLQLGSDDKNDDSDMIVTSF